MLVQAPVALCCFLFHLHSINLKENTIAKRTTAKKSTSNTIQAGDFLTIGLDIGYGVVKAVTDTAFISFPSVMGHDREIKFQHETIQQKYPGDLALAQVPFDTPGEMIEAVYGTSITTTIIPNMPCKMTQTTVFINWVLDKEREYYR